MDYELQKAAAIYEAHTKRAAGDSLQERQMKLYEAFIQETGKALPKALEAESKSMGVELAVMKPRDMGLKFQLSFDGYLLKGGRGEKMPDFIGRVLVEKKATASNFLSWSLFISRVGQRHEEGDEGHVDSAHTPEFLASTIAYSLKRALGAALR